MKTELWNLIDDSGNALNDEPLRAATREAAALEFLATLRLRVRSETEAADLEAG